LTTIFPHAKSKTGKLTKQIENRRIKVPYIEEKMKKIFMTSLLIITVLGFHFQSIAQFKPEELAERPRWEEFLKAAEIVGSADIPEGVTKPIQLFLKKGEVKGSGAWKNPEGVRQGYLEGWQYEIAAYEMDKLLGLDMVPPTVERIFKGKRGSLQLWIEFEYSLLEIMEQKIQFPAAKLGHLNKIKYLTRAFDCLIANEDRTQQNIRYTQDWQMILIDHSRSFRSSKKFTKQLMFGRKGRMGNKPFRQLPRYFVEKIKALNFDSIKKAVGPYLKDKEIKAILIRRDLLLEEIEEMIKEKGEDKVLY